LFVLFAFTYTASAIPVQTEIINTSKLEKTTKERGKKEFTVIRDIFSPFKKIVEKNQPEAIHRPPVEIQKPPEEENRVKERDVAGEVRRRVVYEGYVIRDSNRLALLNVDAEFFVVALDEYVKETIRIVNIEKNLLTVEVEANLIEIKIKEEQNNEIQ
jgi:hypothetical protein